MTNVMTQAMSPSNLEASQSGVFLFRTDEEACVVGEMCLSLHLSVNLTEGLPFLRLLSSSRIW